MFGKVFKAELEWILQRTWRFFIAMTVACILGGLMIAFDDNPYEMMGTIMGFFLIGLGILVFFVSTVIFGCASLHRCFSAKSAEEQEAAIAAPYKTVMAKVLAFETLMVLILLLIFAGLSVLFRDFFAGKWQQGLEFFAYAVIMLPLPMLAVAACVAAARTKCEAILAYAILMTVFVGMLGFGSFVMQILLIEASPSTNMRGLWIAILAILAICAAFDVGSAAFIGHILKKRSTCLHENNNTHPLS